MDLYLGGLIIGKIFASEIWGAYFRNAYFYFYLFIYFFWGGEGGGLIIGILRYACKNGIEFFGEINGHSLNRTIRGQFRPKTE